MSLFYLESSILVSSLSCSIFWARLSKRSVVRPLSLGCLGPPFIGKGGALGQPKGSGGVFGGKKPLPGRVKETWQLLLHGGPCAVAIKL